MIYNIIQPPFTLKFQEMSKTELKAYFQWFLDTIPVRIRELSEVIRQTPGFSAWDPDCSPASLDLLGGWFSTQFATRPRTNEEIRELGAKSSFPIPISGNELENRTFSLAMDIGMYLSQVFLKQYPSLHWEQPFGNKKFVDYGQPVLVPFKPAPFNPVRMMVTLAYGLSTKTKSGEKLREIYEIWSQLVSHKVSR